MTASLPRLLLTAAVSAGLLFGLAACGKKGAPKPPAGEESQYQYPHHYPAPETVVPNGSAPSADAADPLSIFDSEKRSRTTTYCSEPDEQSFLPLPPRSDSCPPGAPRAPGPPSPP